uniref:Uncharacterized protein n=1 Tax=Anguilla anguilla TaxID=7936 RepID=A0A0E9RIM8_ANGAN
MSINCALVNQMLRHGICEENNSLDGLQNFKTLNLNIFLVAK